MESRTIRIEKYPEQSMAAYEFLPEADLRCLVIVCHGFRGTKENGGKIFSFAERLNQLGLGVYAFDFGGSGESDGDFAEVTLTGQADDLTRVIDYVYSIHQVPVILLGRSFGGSTVITAASRDRRVAGCALWSTPVKMQDTFMAMLGAAYQELEAGQEVCFSDEGGMFWIGPELIKDFTCHNMESYLRSLGKKPVLIVQGRDDETVDPANAEIIYSNCSNADLVLIEGADHRFSNRTREREDITVEWLQRKFSLE